MRSKPQLEGGQARIIKWIVISLMGLLLSMNTIISITKPYPILKAMYLTIPYLSIIIIGLKFSTKTFLTITFLIIALVSAIDQTSHVDYSGSVFFILSYAVNKNKKYAVFIGLLTLISISLRAYINDLSIFQAFNLTLAYSLVYSLFYLLVLKKPKHILTNLNKSEYERIKLYSKGMTTEQINDILKLNIDPRNIRQSITEVRKRFGCKNDIEFTIKLLQMQELLID